MTTNMQEVVRLVRNPEERGAKILPPPFRTHSDFPSISRQLPPTRQTKNVPQLPLVIDWSHPRPDTSIPVNKQFLPDATINDILHATFACLLEEQRDVRLRGRLSSPLALMWLIHRYVDKCLPPVRCLLERKYEQARLLSPSSSILLSSASNAFESELYDIKYNITLASQALLSVTSLDMSRIMLKDLGQIGWCSNLRTLIAPNNYLTSLEALIACPHLELLDVTNNQIIWLPEKVFKNFQNLRFLYLARNNIWHRHLLHPLSYCSRLVALDVRDTLIDYDCTFRRYVAATFPSIVVLDGTFLCGLNEGQLVDVSSGTVLASARQLSPNTFTVVPFADFLMETGRINGAVNTASELDAELSAINKNQRITKKVTNIGLLLTTSAEGEQIYFETSPTLPIVTCDVNSVQTMWNQPANVCISYDLEEKKITSKARRTVHTKLSVLCNESVTSPHNFVQECKAGAVKFVHSIRFPQLEDEKSSVNNREKDCTTKTHRQRLPEQTVHNAAEQSNQMPQIGSSKNCQRNHARQHFRQIQCSTFDKFGKASKKRRRNSSQRTPPQQQNVLESDFACSGIDDHTGAPPKPKKSVQLKIVRQHLDQQELVDYGLLGQRQIADAHVYLQERNRLFEPKQYTTTSCTLDNNILRGQSAPKHVRRCRRKRPGGDAGFIHATTDDDDHFTYVRRMADMHTEIEEAAIDKWCAANDEFQLAECHRLHRTVQHHHLAHSYKRQSRSFNPSLLTCWDAGFNTPQRQLDMCNEYQYNRFMYLRAKKENKQTNLLREEFNGNRRKCQQKLRVQNRQQLAYEQRQAVAAAEFEAFSTHAHVRNQHELLKMRKNLGENAADLRYQNQKALEMKQFVLQSKPNECFRRHPALTKTTF